MRKAVSLLLAALLLFGAVSLADSAALTPGTYEVEKQGFLF